MKRHKRTLGRVLNRNGQSEDQIIRSRLIGSCIHNTTGETMENPRFRQKDIDSAHIYGFLTGCSFAAFIALFTWVMLS